MACKPLNMTIPEDHGVDESPIIMVDRGNCSFVTKVKNVEEAGGHIALIINNDPNQSLDEIIMADDGRGRDLVIPGVLISYQDGQILKEFYRENKMFSKIIENINIEVDFEIENRTNIVKLDFYVSSKSENFYKLILELSNHLKVIKDSIDMNVYYISEPNYSYIEGQFKELPNCLGSGLHCHNPGKFSVSDGRVFVEEDIKQKCILKYARENKDIGLYVDYVTNFFKTCVNKTAFNPECSAIVVKTSDLPIDKINECFHDSFNLSGLSPNNILNYKIFAKNKLLMEDSYKKTEHMISYLPSLLINNRNFWGSWTNENVFEALCSAYQKKPEICYDEGYFHKPTSLGGFSVFLLILLVVFVNVLIFMVCKNYIRNRITERIESTDINHKINTVVTSYLALRENK